MNKIILIFVMLLPTPAIEPEPDLYCDEYIEDGNMDEYFLETEQLLMEWYPLSLDQIQEVRKFNGSM